MSQQTASVESILIAAVDIALPAQRQEFVQKACAGDALLQRQVEWLVENHFRAGSFMERPAAVLETADFPTKSDILGTRIGPYKLLERLGEGGMGVVYLADQKEPIRRQVALKVIKPGMDSQQVLARFEAERQALALMDHPNIARVLDAGTTASGHPFFVMELVRGIPITDYCDQARLSVRQRLEVFLQVCRAVQHAHTKGVIHRDLKPTNVLVTSHDGIPVPKVIDFGVVKALGQQLTEQTVHTAFAQMVGTPLYMSPEQAEFNQLGVDTRSDIYSLGVLLYELLTGVTPFDQERFRTVGFDELRRILREEEPPKPSTRLSTLAAALSTVSERRSVDARKLHDSLKGELDWIVLKALEKDRTRRYETASAFAADVERYLGDEQVEACPPTTGYRLRKFIRRNRRVLSTAGLLTITVMVVVGTLAGSIGWATRDQAARQAEAERDRAARQAEVARGVNDALAESERDYRESKTLEALSAARRAQVILAAGPGDEQLSTLVRDRVKDLETVLQLDENFLVVNIDKNVREEYRIDKIFVREWRAEFNFEQLFRNYGIDFSVHSVDEATQQIRSRFIAVDLAAGLDQWIHTRVQQGTVRNDPFNLKLLAVARQVDPDPWRDRIRKAHERDDTTALEELARTAPIDQFPLATIRALGQTLYFCYPSGAPNSPARDFLLRAQRRHPGDLWLNFLLAGSLCWHSPFRFDEAIGFFRAYLALRPNSPRIYECIGRVMDGKGNFGEAVSCFREAIRLNLNSIEQMNSLAQLSCTKQRMSEAHDYFRKAIAHDSTDVLAHSMLATVLVNQGSLDQGIDCYRKAIQLDPKAPFSHLHLGYALYGKERWDEAIACYREFIDLYPKQYTPIYRALGNALRGKKQWDEAIELFSKGAVEIEQTNGPLDTTGFYFDFGMIFYRKGDYDKSIPYFERASRFSPGREYPYAHLGYARYLTGDLDGAVVACRKAVELNWTGRATCSHVAGLALIKQGKWNEAIVSFRDAAEFRISNVPGVNSKLFTARSKGVLSLLLSISPDPKLRNYDEALEHAQSGLKFHPKEHHSQTALGIAYYRKGDYKAAAEELKKALDLVEFYCIPHFVMAMTLWQLGDKEEAQRRYQLGVDRLPGLRRKETSQGMFYREVPALTTLMYEEASDLLQIPKEATK